MYACARAKANYSEIILDWEIRQSVQANVASLIIRIIRIDDHKSNKESYFRS